MLQWHPLHGIPDNEAADKAATQGATGDQDNTLFTARLVLIKTTSTADMQLAPANTETAGGSLSAANRLQQAEPA